jgi:effector-binding domain-containing protein
MEIKETKEQPTVSIRFRTNMDKISQDIGKGYGEIMRYLGEKQIQPIGAPYAMYYNEDMNNLDMEVGFPVASSIPEKDNIKMSKLPGGKAAVYTHTGPYNKLGEAYEKLMDWMKEKNLTPSQSCYEIYIDDPENTPEDKLKTEIYFPIK